MSEFKGTPGPWKYTVRNVNEIMTTFHGVAVGDTYIEVATRNEQEDARLISAAPDLLAALQSVLSVADRATVEFDMARAAISKATGE